MGEPVGNGPRELRPTIPTNSYKDREATKAVEETREPLEKIVQGKVIIRKSPWFRRAARSLVADDANTLGEYIIFEMVLPKMKDMIRDVFVGSIDRTLYGGGIRSSRSSSGSNYRGGANSIREKYHQMSSGGDPRPSLSREDRANHDFNNIVLEREEAINVISRLIQQTKSEYGVATVADLYDFIGYTGGSFADRRQGWTDLSEADVRQTREGWRLILPRPESFR